MPINPAKLRLEASSHCQLRCPSCPTTTGHAAAAVGGGFLRFADFRALVDANPQVNDVELSNYGEIFLNPELADIIGYADEKRVALRADNGVNFNNVRSDVLQAMVQHRFRSLRVSIDGASEDTYQRYRVRGSFARVIENVRALQALKADLGSALPALTWQFVVFGHNEHELPAARKLAAELGMAFQAKLSWDEAISPVHDPDFVKRQTGLAVASRSEYLAANGRDYAGGLCHQLWDRPQVNWDGRILGCCRNFWGEFGGNAFTDGLVPALNGERIEHARGMLLGERAPRADVPCTTCSIYLEMRKRQV